MEKKMMILGLFLFLLSFVSAQINYSGCWGSGMMYGYGYGIFGWIMPTLMTVALVLFIIWIIKQIQKK